MFGGDHDLEAYKLLQGIDNMSLVAGRALWALSRKAKADPGVANLILDTDAVDVSSDFIGMSIPANSNSSR